MSEIKISSTGWLAVFLQNGAVGVFNLNNTRSWQCLPIETILNRSKRNNSNRNLLKFSPNGRILVVNEQNKQLKVYTQTDYEETDGRWEVQRTFITEKHISALDLTNEFLLVGDHTGDIYKIDFSLNDNHNSNLILTEENRIAEYSSNLFDIVFVHLNRGGSFILTTDQNAKIHLNSYPNVSEYHNYCCGHTEFVSQIKLINNDQLLSVSGDGTFRLWHLPDCTPLAFLHSQAFILSSKQIFYTQLYESTDIALSRNELRDFLLEETECSSPSIWKMDLACCDSNVYIAFSIYVDRSHSIYLTSLANMKALTDEPRKLILDSSYGNIVDYCFSSKEIVTYQYMDDSKCYLYILFNSNTLLKVDIISVLSYNGTELFEQSDETIQEINTVLASKEFHPMDCVDDDIECEEIGYSELFENCQNSNDKRKMERTEEQDRKKRATSFDEENISSAKYA